jgi:hypothetical protein
MDDRITLVPVGRKEPIVVGTKREYREFILIFIVTVLMVTQ